MPVILETGLANVSRKSTREQSQVAIIWVEEALASHTLSTSAHRSEEGFAVDPGFCPTRSFSCSVPRKHTEVYINYKLTGLVAQASY